MLLTSSSHVEMLLKKLVLVEAVVHMSPMSFQLVCLLVKLHGL